VLLRYTEPKPWCFVTSRCHRHCDVLGLKWHSVCVFSFFPSLHYVLLPFYLLHDDVTSSSYTCIWFRFCPSQMSVQRRLCPPIMSIMTLGEIQTNPPQCCQPSDCLSLHSLMWWHLPRHTSAVTAADGQCHNFSHFSEALAVVGWHNNWCDHLSNYDRQHDVKHC